MAVDHAGAVQRVDPRRAGPQVVGLPNLVDRDSLALALDVAARAVAAERRVGVGRLLVAGDLRLAQIGRADQREVEEVVQRLILLAEGQQDRLLDALQRRAIAAGPAAACHVGGKAQMR